MKRIAVILATVSIVAPAQLALARASVDFTGGKAASAQELPPYLQCVPYARQLTGIQIFGDAHTWWGQAAGKYERGRAPRVGAVMAFRPHRNMQLGHVAAVSKVVDARTVLLDHANWSPINGRRGQIERDVMAVDVSPGNDWSEVRVWYAPQSALGTSTWPVHGFIYGQKAKLDRGSERGLDRGRIAAAAPQKAAVRAVPPLPPVAVVVRRELPAALAPVQMAPQPATPSRSFTNAFAGFGAAAPAAPQALRPVHAPQVRAAAAPPARAVAPRPSAALQPRQLDPIDAALARYGR